MVIVVRVGFWFSLVGLMVGYSFLYLEEGIMRVKSEFIALFNTWLNQFRNWIYNRSQVRHGCGSCLVCLNSI